MKYESLRRLCWKLIEEKNEFDKLLVDLPLEVATIFDLMDDIEDILVEIHNSENKLKFIVIEDVDIEFPGYIKEYKRGDIIHVSSGDYVSEEGIHVCFGYGAFNLIPIANLLKVNDRK